MSTFAKAVSILTAVWAETLDALKSAGAFRSGVVHRVLLYGPPATGKSSWAEYAYGAGSVERVPLHRQMPDTDLIGAMQLVAENGGTKTVWADGPAVRAMRNGTVLVLDEIDKHSPEIVSALHAILDDLSIAGITLPTGERVTPQPGYMVIATTNAKPDALPEAMQTRFDLKLLAATPAPGILDALDKGEAQLVRRTYDRAPAGQFAWSESVGVRSMLAFHRLRSVVSADEAASLVFGADAATDILASIAVQE